MTHSVYYAVKLTYCWEMPIEIQFQKIKVPWLPQAEKGMPLRSAVLTSLVQSLPLRKKLLILHI